VRRRRGLLLAAVLAALPACAPASRALAPRPVLAPPDLDDDEGRGGAGVIHVVKKGQTLYRIARFYGIDESDLMETNGITDPRTVDVGQELFIPGARAVLEVPPAPAPLPGEPLDPPAPRAARPSALATARPAAPRAEHAAPATEPAAVVDVPRGAATFTWPLKGVLYSRFGVRGKSRHDGIDIAAPMGSPVTAAGDGTVIFVGVQSGYGKVVIVRHQRGLVTVYAHNSEVLVREGAHVARGQLIAKVGQTGRTTGPHLHFEVRDGVKPKNPLLYLP
jgi:lipoprotein NlpD